MTRTHNRHRPDAPLDDPVRPARQTSPHNADRPQRYADARRSGLTRRPLTDMNEAMTMTMPPARDGMRRLVLVPLGDGAWRLCDRSLAEDDPVSVVAYVEQLIEGFEVVWLQGRSGIAVFPDLEAVLQAALVEQTSGLPRSTRPIDIPHFAPRTVTG